MSKSALFQTTAAIVFMGTAALSEASTWTGNATADAFVAVGSGSNPIGSDLTAINYGGAGTLAIAPASSLKGEFQSLLKFDLSGTAGAAAQFDTQYGVGNWQITGISLTLASNFAVSGAQPNNAIFNVINGGSFGISWLSDDSWIEGTGNPSNTTPATDGSVTYDSLSTLLSGTNEQVGTYNYVPPGNNVPLTWNLGLTSDFLTDATSSDKLSFLFYATPGSDVSYLFNSKTFATNHPLITVTAIPEPGTVAMLGLGGSVLAQSLRRLRWA